MKFYDAKFVKGYIEAYKSVIDTITLGIKEDWRNTSDTIFANGKLKKKFFKGNNKVEVMGITGSGWGTPIMEVIAKDGSTTLIECFFDDGNKISAEAAFACFQFAKSTGAYSYYDCH